MPAQHPGVHSIRVRAASWREAGAVRARCTSVTTLPHSTRLPACAPGAALHRVSDRLLPPACRADCCRSAAAGRLGNAVVLAERVSCSWLAIVFCEAEGKQATA